MQTIYLQIGAAGGQQLFGRMGGANINYLKQQICVSNTFTKSTELSILHDWIKCILGGLQKKAMRLKQFFG